MAPPGIRLKPGRVELRQDWEFQVNEELRPTWEAMGAFGKDRARAIVPVLTGYLRSTIDFKVYRRGVTLVLALFASAPYARHVEDGTRFMAAQPYLRPAALQAVRLVTSGGLVRL